MALLPDQGSFSDALEQLAAHERWRKERPPVLSVIVGPSSLGLRTLRSWATHEGRSLALTDAVDVKSAIQGWVFQIARAADLRQAAIEYAAERLETTAVVLGRRLEAMTSFELDAMLETALTDEGILKLVKLPKLKSVHLSDCRLSDELIRRLYQEDPHWMISYAR